MSGLTYPALRCVFEHFEANKRINITSRIPYLKKIERTIPMHLESLEVHDDSVKLNNVMYSGGPNQNLDKKREMVIDIISHLLIGASEIKVNILRIGDIHFGIVRLLDFLQLKPKRVFLLTLKNQNVTVHFPFVTSAKELTIKCGRKPIPQWFLADSPISPKMIFRNVLLRDVSGMFQRWRGTIGSMLVFSGSWGNSTLENFKKQLNAKQVPMENQRYLDHRFYSIPLIHPESAEMIWFENFGHIELEIVPSGASTNAIRNKVKALNLQRNSDTPICSIISLIVLCGFVFIALFVHKAFVVL